MRNIGGSQSYLEQILLEGEHNLSKSFVPYAVTTKPMVADFVKAAYRAYTGIQVWRKGPRLLLNTVPKAGTHLLKSVLGAVPGIANSGWHVNTWQVHLGAGGSAENPEFRFDERAFRRYLSRIRGGQFFTGHLLWAREFVDTCNSEGVKIIHLIRDPRDVVISRLHYIKGLKKHYLHRTLMERYSNDEDRLIALIRGDQTNASAGYVNLASSSAICDLFAGWLQAPEVLVVRFEDLVGDRGGGTELRKRAAMEQIINHLGISLDRSTVDAIIAHSSDPKSLTFRQGKIGSWRRESSTLQQALDREFRQPLIDLNYSVT